MPDVDGVIDGVGQQIAVEARDRDAVDALGDERLENLLLPDLVGALRPAPDDLDAAELLRRPLGPGARIVEHGDVQRLGNDREAQRTGLIGPGTATPEERDGTDQNGHEAQGFQHRVHDGSA